MTAAFTHSVCRPESAVLSDFLCVALISLCWLISLFHHHCSTASPPLPPPPVSQCLGAVLHLSAFNVSGDAADGHEHQALSGRGHWPPEERGGSGGPPSEELPLSHHVHLFLSCMAHQYCGAGFLCAGESAGGGVNVHVWFLFMNSYSIRYVKWCFMRFCCLHSVHKKSVNMGHNLWISTLQNRVGWW